MSKWLVTLSVDYERGTFCKRHFVNKIIDFEKDYPTKNEITDYLYNRYFSHRDKAYLGGDVEYHLPTITFMQRLAED